MNDLSYIQKCLRVLLILVTLATTVYVLFTPFHFGSRIIINSLDAPGSYIVQVFYDIGNGFNEADSVNALNSHYTTIQVPSFSRMDGLRIDFSNKYEPHNIGYVIFSSRGQSPIILTGSQFVESSVAGNVNHIESDGINITVFPLNDDSWFVVSPELLYELQTYCTYAATRNVVNVTLMLLALVLWGILLHTFSHWLVKVVNVFLRNKELTLYLSFLFLIYSLWAMVTPLNGAPDEYMRWELIVHMIETGNLPRGDDPSIRNYLWGFSYAFYPFTTQIIGAVFYQLASNLFSNAHVLLYFARLPSIISSVATMFFVFQIGKILFSVRWAWFLTILMSMWPQFAMISSYINNDSFALLAIAIILYSWVLGIKSNWCMKSCIMLGIGVGLCLLSYYNAFTFILLSVPLWFWVVLSNRENRAVYPEFIKKIGIMLSIAILIAGWFYIRNAYLYDGDFLGVRTLNEHSELYAVEWLRPSNRLTFLDRGYTVIDMLRTTTWVNTSYRTFIAGFGYMNIFPHRMVYDVFTIIIATGLLGSMFKVVKIFFLGEKHSLESLFYMFTIISIPITIGLSIYHSFAVGFQPQGRYLLPMLLPACIVIMVGLRFFWLIIAQRFKLYESFILFLASGIIILLNLISLFSVFDFYFL